jgi:hypothetical protein
MNKLTNVETIFSDVLAVSKKTHKHYKLQQKNRIEGKLKERGIKRDEMTNCDQLVQTASVS